MLRTSFFACSFNHNLSNLLCFVHPLQKREPHYTNAARKSMSPCRPCIIVYILVQIHLFVFGHTLLICINKQIRTFYFSSFLPLPPASFMVRKNTPANTATPSTTIPMIKPVLLLSSAVSPVVGCEAGA